MFPQFEVIKLFFTGTKGVFWLFFGIVALFLIWGVSCGPKDKDVIEVHEAPPVELSILKPVLKIQDEIIHKDQINVVDTTKKVEEIKVITVKKIKKINKDPQLNPEQQSTQIGDAQITGMTDLYNQYYGSSSPPEPVSTLTPLVHV